MCAFEKNGVLWFSRMTTQEKANIYLYEAEVAVYKSSGFQDEPASFAPPEIRHRACFANKPQKKYQANSRSSIALSRTMRPIYPAENSCNQRSIEQHDCARRDAHLAQDGLHQGHEAGRPGNHHLEDRSSVNVRARSPHNGMHAAKVQKIAVDTSVLAPRHLDGEGTPCTLFPVLWKRFLHNDHANRKRL